jgi:hypothetical protein
MVKFKGQKLVMFKDSMVKDKISDLEENAKRMGDRWRVVYIGHAH